jgi:hypothetical protein
MTAGRNITLNTGANILSAGGGAATVSLIAGKKYSSALQINGAITTSGGNLNLFNLQTGNLTGSGNLTLGGGSLNLYSPGSNSLSGIIAGTNSNLNLLSRTDASLLSYAPTAANGVTTISGANTYTGSTTIDQGTLIASHATALGANNAAGSTVNPGAILLLNNILLDSGKTGANAAVTLNNGTLETIGNAGLNGILNATTTTTISTLGPTAGATPGTGSGTCAGLGAAGTCKLTLSGIHIADGQTLTLGDNVSASTLLNILGTGAISHTGTGAKPNLTVRTAGNATIGNIGSATSPFASVVIDPVNTILNDITADTITITNVANSNNGNASTPDSSVTLNGTLTALAAGTAGFGYNTTLLIVTDKLINTTGATALNTTGANSRWLVWSGDPSIDNRNGLTYGFKQYNAIYNPNGSMNTLEVLEQSTTKNGFLYKKNPSLTASLVGPITRPYNGNDTSTPALTAANYTLSGAIDGDIAVLVNPPTSGTYDTPHASTSVNKSVSVTLPVTTTINATDGTATVYGYSVTTGLITTPNVGQITALPISLGAASAPITKTYDGTTTASSTAADYMLSGFLPGDSRAVSSVTSATYADTHASANNPISAVVQLSGTLNTTQGSVLTDYDFSQATTSTTIAGSITPRPLTVISSTPGATSLTKVYDGTTDATAGQGAGAFIVSNYAPNSGDNYTLTGVSSATYASTHASTAVDNLVTFSGLTFGSFTAGSGISPASLASDYTLPTTNGNYTQLGQITPKPLSLVSTGSGGGGAITKIYDGTTLAAGSASNFSLSGFVSGSGDDWALSGLSGNYASSHASNSANNTITFNSVVPGTFTAGAGVTPGQPSQSTDYSLPAVSGYTQAGQITARPLTLISSAPGATSLTKVYDGTTDATAGQGAGAFIVSNYAPNSGDNYTITGVSSATYANTHASTAIDNLVTFSGLTFGSFTAGTGLASASLSTDYLLPTTTGNYSQLGQITKRQLTLISSTPGATSLTKVYDGTNNAGSGSSAFIVSNYAPNSGDNYAITGVSSATYASTHASTAVDNLVTFSGLTFSSLTAGSGLTSPSLSTDYDLPTTNGNYTQQGQITPKKLSLVSTGNGSVITKIYDGTNNAGGSASDFSLSGFVSGSGDNITVTGLTSATYANIHASTAIDNLVTFSGLTFGSLTAGSGLTSPSESKDYDLPTTNGNYTQLGQIGARPLIIQSIGKLSKEYDGTLNTFGTTAQVSVSNYQINNLIAGDSATVSADTAFYNAAQVLQAHYITASGLSLTSLNSNISAISDYSISNTSVNIDAQVTPKALTALGLSVAPSKTYDGKLSITVNAANNSSLLGIIGTDQVNLSSQLIGLFENRNVGANKLLSLPSSNLTGQDASNYTVQAQQPLTSSITKALLTLQPEPETVDYGVLPSNPVQITGLQNNEQGLFDSISNLYSTFASTNKVKAGKNCCTIIVQAGYIVEDGNGGNNYAVTEGTAPGSVNARLPGTSTGTATTAANPNGGGGQSSSSTEGNNLWSNGRNASGENNGLSSKTTDKTQWNVTDPVTSKRALLGCRIFAQGVHEATCGRNLAHRSDLTKTRSYQPKIAWE